MSSNGTFSSGRRDHGQFAQPPPNGPTLSPFLPPSLRPSSFNPSPSTTSSSYYILPNPTPVSAFIPILARGRARGRNPFEVLSAPVFDEFIDDVTTRIRNALLGPPPPPPLPKPVAEESIPKEKEIADVFGQVVAVGQRVNGRNSDGVTAHMFVVFVSLFLVLTTIGTLTIFSIGKVKIKIEKHQLHPLPHLQQNLHSKFPSSVLLLLVVVQIMTMTRLMQNVRLMKKQMSLNWARKMTLKVKLKVRKMNLRKKMS